MLEDGNLDGGLIGLLWVLWTDWNWSQLRLRHLLSGMVMDILMDVLIDLGAPDGLELESNGDLDTQWLYGLNGVMGIEEAKLPRFEFMKLEFQINGE